MIFAGATQGQINIEIKKLDATLTPKPGFHLNDKAPAYYQTANSKTQPIVKTEQKFVFKAKDEKSEGTILFYVCDDAKTICDKHEVAVSFKKGQVTTNQVQQANERLSGALKKEATNSGFQKTTLLIFSAPWCPACMRMHSEVFPKTVVKNVLQKIEVKKINIDLVENESLSTKYGVKAIPTVILVNDQGEELYRWLDYQPADKFAAELKTEISAGVSTAELEKKAAMGDVVSSVKLGKIYYSKMDWEKAAKYLAASKLAEDINWRLSAEVNAATDAKDDDDKKTSEYQQTLEKAYVLSSSKLDQLRWKLEFAESKKDTIEGHFVNQLAEQLIELEQEKNLEKEFSKSTYGDPAGFAKTEILDMLSRAYGILKNDKKKSDVQKQIAQQIKNTKLNFNYPGQIVSAIQYLNQVGDDKEAEKLSLKLIEKFPETYVYYNRYATFLSKQNRNQEALVQINKALNFKEGNEPQLNMNKIKILKGLKQKKEALDLVGTTLELIKPHGEKYKRTKASLEKLKDELSKE